MSEPESPFWDYLDALLFALAFAPALIAGGLLARAFFGGLSLHGSGKAPELLAAQFLAYGFWFTVLYGLLRVRYGRPFWVALGWVRFRERFVERLAIGVAVALTVAVLGGLLHTPDLDSPMKRLLSDRLSLVLVGVAAATAGPVCEELAFRGFFQPLLVRSMGPAPGIVLTALPFAVLHGPEYAWSWRHILLVTIAGSAFGWMRHRTGSTAAAAVMHAGYNATFFLALLISGKDLPAKW
jgi:hypothetical protein